VSEVKRLKGEKANQMANRGGKEVQMVFQLPLAVGFSNPALASIG